jgi:hypothetical protein
VGVWGGEHIDSWIRLILLVKMKVAEAKEVWNDGGNAAKVES